MRMTQRTAAMAAIGMALVLALAVPTAGGSKRNFHANLSGAQEVPAVDTQARGNLTLQLSKDGTELSYKLIVANIDDVVAAHLHLGVVGMNGPVVVPLFSGSPSGTVNGTLAEGTITEADLTGPLAGASLSDLVDAIEDGDIYTNVHTVVHQPGEIRGQVR